jgi:uncharacterized protein YkwD
MEASKGAPPTGSRRLGALLISFLALSGCGDDPVGPEMAQPADPNVQAFVEEVNAYRGTVGCGPLAWRSDVAGVAQSHSQDMVARDYFDHYTPEGASPFDRLTAAGIAYSLAAENIAYGYPTASTVLAGWLGSPGHKANLDNCALTGHGVGLDGTHWTHLFVTP